jgi:hypothetical protein
MLLPVNERLAGMPFASVLWKNWLHAIESGSMIEVNLASFFYFGNSIRRLSDIQEGQPVSAWAPVLYEAREGLKAFLANAERTRMFSQNVRWAVSILNTINSMMPEVPPGTLVKDRQIFVEEVKSLIGALNTFAILLSEESERAYVVILEKQRTFDLHTLVESISTAFDAAVWDSLSGFSKREIKEAGRCLALERYTACGFHMMRAVERESCDCATLVAQANPVRRDFGDYLKTLEHHGAEKKVIAVLDSLRSLERNPLVHPQDWLSQDDAVNMFCIAQVALSRLISCVETMKLFPPKDTP